MTEKYRIEGMSCSACSAAVEKAVSRLNGVERASVDLLSKTMVCDYSPETVSSESIMAAVKKAGFSAAVLLPETQKAKTESVESSFITVKRRIIVSAVLLLPLMYITMADMLNLPIPAFLNGDGKALLRGLIQLVLTVPIVAVNFKFYSVGAKALLNKAPNMDTLVAVSSLASFVYSIFSLVCAATATDTAETAKYINNLYFDSGAMILTLVTFGKYLEDRAKTKTVSALDALLELAPKTANVIRDGVEVTVPVEELKVGDFVAVRPGESVAADGTVVNGSSFVDESALTGESVAVEKTVHSTVMSASVNQNGSFVMRVDKVGADTALAKIISLVETAGASKAPIARVADKVAGVFVPVVIVLSLLSGVMWLALGKSFSFAFSIAVSVLVISCPCALGLATPVAVTASIGRSASDGILIKSAEIPELICKCDTAVFDKTGTVTEGRPTVTDIIPLTESRREFMKIAASLEEKSEHPLSSAILQANSYGIYEDVTDFCAVAGRGVTALINGKRYYGGNLAYMEENGVSSAKAAETAERLADDGKTVMFFADSENIIGIIAASDVIRETGKDAIKHLHSLGLTVTMLTGDNERAANAVARAVGIDNVVAQVLPQDKEAVVARLQKEGKRVIMVGDGINDSPALTRADVGMAVASGTDIAIGAADVVLMKNDMRDVANAVVFARKTMRIIKQNLFWAFFYNVLCIPLAAGALYVPLGITLNPMICAAAMCCSSLFVVTNALRLYKKEKKVL